MLKPAWRLAVMVVALAVATGPTLGTRTAGAESVEQRLARAKADHEAAQARLSQAQADLSRLLGAYQGLREQLTGAAREVQTAHAEQESLAQQLAAAQERLNERVTTAYELGPAASVDLFLGSQSVADFASVQVFAANTFAVDDSTVSEVTSLKAALAATTRRVEARQRDLSDAIRHVQDMAAVATAEADDARRDVSATGNGVKALEKELAAARAAAAAALANYLGSSGIGVGCASGPVHDLIVKSFSPLGQDQVTTALAVATRESNCRPEAFNSTEVPPYGNASGVFQILVPGIWEPWSQQCGHAGDSAFDPEANVAVAACVVADQGWWPWGF